MKTLHEVSYKMYVPQCRSAGTQIDQLHPSLLLHRKSKKHLKKTWYHIMCIVMWLTISKQFLQYKILPYFKKIWMYLAVGVYTGNLPL